MQSEEIKKYLKHIPEFENKISQIEKYKITYVWDSECKQLIYWSDIDNAYLFFAEPLNECAMGDRYKSFTSEAKDIFTDISTPINNDGHNFKIVEYIIDYNAFEFTANRVEFNFSSPKKTSVTGLLFEKREILKPKPEDSYSIKISDNWYLSLYHPSPF